jgi:hypothetical protein
MTAFYSSSGSLALSMCPTCPRSLICEGQFPNRKQLLVKCGRCGVWCVISNSSGSRCDFLYCGVFRGVSPGEVRSERPTLTHTWSHSDWVACDSCWDLAVRSSYVYVFEADPNMYTRDRYTQYAHYFHFVGRGKHWMLATDVWAWRAAH